MIFSNGASHSSLERLMFATRFCEIALARVT
jgi:hypothetical protein